MGSPYFAGLNVQQAEHDPLDDIRRLLARGVGGPGARSVTGGFGYAGQPTDYSQLGDIPEAAQPAPPAPSVTPTRIPVDDPGIPALRPIEEQAGELADMYLRDSGGLPSYLKRGDVPSAMPSEARRGGRVAVTIGGKTYDYGAGESIPTMFKGQFGEGNLAANQPGGVVPGREPSQISMAGLAEEARRGGTGVSMMQELDGDVPQSELESASRRAALSGFEAKANDPYGIEAYRQRAEVERVIRSADEHAKGEETRRTQDATRAGFTSEMNAAFGQYQTEKARLEGAKGRLTPEQYKALSDQLDYQLEFDKQTIGGKYGVKMPSPVDFSG